MLLPGTDFSIQAAYVPAGESCTTDTPEWGRGGPPTHGLLCIDFRAFIARNENLLSHKSLYISVHMASFVIATDGEHRNVL